MGFTTKENMVRVDFFKPSGKWYCTEEVAFIQYDGLIHEAFRRSLNASVGGRLKGMTAVCLEPYHEYSHPISLVME